MKHDDLADATARALDLLPPEDPSRSDPRFLRDSGLLDEARMTRDTAADVWLAVSPLRVAPPGVLHSIMEAIDPPSSGKFTGSGRVLPWLAASGWAAAAGVTLLLWPHAPDEPTAIPAAGADMSRGAQSDVRDTTPPARIASTRDARLRNEIIRLQTRLDAMRDDRHSKPPRVLSLSAPGNLRRSPEEARQRIQAILTEALRVALETESGAPSDKASLVIERGWLPGGLPVPESGAVVRHRSFPEHAWKELGLQRSEDGAYYDPASRMMWTADPEGRGFMGRRIESEDELTGFQNEPDPQEPSIRQVIPRTMPEGFVIENPVRNSVEVVIDQIPEPAEGNAQFIVWTDNSGVENTVPLDSSSQLQNSSMSYGGFTGGTLVTSIPNSFGLTSFQLVERPLVANGQPDRVIVESGP